jgi:hypothetical protein
MGTLYDLVYKYVDNPSVGARFFVHWRVPPSRATGVEYGPYEESPGSTNLLRDFDADVGAVLLLETQACPWDYRHPHQPVPQTSTIHELGSKFRPEAMEVHNVDMAFRFEEEEEFFCSNAGIWD